MESKIIKSLGLHRMHKIRISLYNNNSYKPLPLPIDEGDRHLTQTPLHEKDNVDDNQRKKAKMNNIFGLEDGRWFKIINCGDHLVVTLQGRKLCCLPEDPQKEQFQTFKSIRQENGAFLIASKYQSSPEKLQVWDFLPHKTFLIQKNKSKGFNNKQMWVSEPCLGMDTLHFLLSAPEKTKCLKNNGEGKQIEVVSKDYVDPYCRWTLEKIGPVLG